MSTGHDHKPFMTGPASTWARDYGLLRSGVPLISLVDDAGVEQFHPECTGAAGKRQRDRICGDCWLLAERRFGKYHTEASTMRDMAEYG